jgi:hypothetical protein
MSVTSRRALDGFFFGQGPEDFLPQLLSHGLSMDGIPHSLGGTWNYINFTFHCEMKKKSIIPKTMVCYKTSIPKTIGTLSWPELVNCILGNLQNELIDSWIWDVDVARLKKALFGSRASLAVNATGCKFPIHQYCCTADPRSFTYLALFLSPLQLER